jgi:peroxiredoxin
LRQDYDEFQRRDAEIIAIAPNNPGAVRKHWESNDIPFPALPDPDKRLLTPLGQEFRLLRFGRLPGLFVIDIGGDVRYAHHGDHAGDIPSNADLLNLLDKINAERSTG